jgi:hypothetical protein
MGVAIPNQDSDGPIHPGVPYDKWMQDRRQADPSGIDTPNGEYGYMLPKWTRIQTVLEGTDAMRAAGRTYLCQHQYETNMAYEERLSASVLDNWTSRTLETLVGKAYKDPPKFDKLPDVLAALEADCDGAQHTMVDVSQEWFREALAKQWAWLYVDMTPGAAKPDGTARTLADDRRDGIRPIWRVICPEDVIFAMGTPLGGRFIWEQVRIAENSMEPSGPFGEELVQRIRVLRPGSWELYRRVQTRKNQKPKWVLEDAGLTGLSEIPIVRFRIDGDKPPLEDLVHLNIAHFQSGSDQRSILTTSRFAMLAASGAPEIDQAAGEKPLVVGPKQWLSMANPEGRFYYVEHTGAAITAGRTDMQDLEQRMASYGAEFLKQQPGRASATGRALDSSEAQSLLQTWVRQFAEVLAQALRYTAMWLRAPVDLELGEVLFELKPDLEERDPTELQTFDRARARGDMSREAWVEEMLARNLFRSNYDAEADKGIIQAELPEGVPVGGVLFQQPPQDAASPPKNPTS